MTDESDEANEPLALVPLSSATEILLTSLASAVPWLGGPLTNISAQIATNRKTQRINEVLAALIEDLRGFKSEVSSEYVRSDEFADFLERALLQIASEPAKLKRLMYQRLVTGAVRTPGGDYERGRRSRTLDTLEEIQRMDIALLLAVRQACHRSVKAPYDVIRTLLGSLHEPMLIYRNQFRWLRDTHEARRPRWTEDLVVESYESQLARLGLVHPLPSVFSELERSADGSTDIYPYTLITKYGEQFLRLLHDPGGHRAWMRAMSGQ